jgi:hypothetical protein
MIRRIALLSPLFAVAAGLGLALAADAPKAKPADVVGNWTGEWGPYSPAAGAVPKDKCKGLDCKVVRNGDVWHATFEGECGRPYKYTIKMEGRQVGDVVLFKGTVDLGAADGGVYDWIGRAGEKDFVGFYTSGHYTGVFTMKRGK